MGRFNWLEFPEESDDNNSKPDQKELKRYDPDHYLEVAQKHYLERDFSNALRFYSRVLHLDRKNIVAWIGQSKSLVRMGELNEAKVWLEKALSAAPDNPELMTAKAYLMLKSRRIDDALACSDNAMQGSYNSPYIWIVRGEIFLVQSKIDLAEHCFSKAMELKPKAGTLFDIGEVYFSNKAYVRSVDTLKEVVEMDATVPHYWKFLGSAYERLDMDAKAKFAYERALELKPKDEDVANRLTALKYKTSNKNVFSKMKDFLKGTQ